VPQLRRKLKEWRDGCYVGATNTSKSLLKWSSDVPGLPPQAYLPLTFWQRSRWRRA
jgi:type III restriction enzyme